MARKPNTAAQIADCNLRLKDLDDVIAGPRQERQAKLLADVDDGREPEAREIDEKIRGLGIEAEGLRDLLQALEARLESERQAKAAKARAGHIERIEALLNERVENGKKITKAVASLIGAVERDIEITKALAAGWPWNTSDRNVLKLFGIGIKQMLAHEFYRQSALKFLGNTGDNAIALPGSVSPRDEWRLQPNKIPPLAKQLEEIAAYASDAMRGAPMPKQPTVEATPPQDAAQVNTNAVLVESEPPANESEMITPEEAVMRANVEAQAARQQIGD